MVGSVVSENGNGKEEEATTGHDVGCDERPTEEPGPSLLPAAEPDSGREQLRRVRGGCLPAVLCGEAGSAKSATRAVLPADAGGVLRGTELGAWDGVAGVGFAGDPEVPGAGA